MQRDIGPFWPPRFRSPRYKTSKLHSARVIRAGLKNCLLLIAAWFVPLWALPACAQTAASVPAPLPSLEFENWNLHLENTDTVQGYPPFHAKYSGVNSLPTGGQIRQSVAVDLLAGLRLRHGAELHFDGIMWQGFGLHDTFGIDDFPNAEAYKSGTAYPRLNLAQLFIRQTIGLGGEKEVEPDDPAHIPGKRDISRLVITVGRFSVINMFDQNSYAGDPTTQFLNWTLVTNAAWDSPAGSLGYTTGLSLGLHPRLRCRLNAKSWRPCAAFADLYQLPIERPTEWRRGVNSNSR
jgi:high affinity Mn2+ porin